MNVQRVVVGVLLSLIGWTSVMAAEDVKGSRDHPLIKRYEGAVIVKYARRISMNIRCAWKSGWAWQTDSIHRARRASYENCLQPSERAFDP